MKADELASKGVGARVLAELSGHRNIATTQRYIDVNDDMLCNAVEKSLNYLNTKFIDQSLGKLSMKNIGGIIILAVGSTLVLGWVVVGCYIFFYPNAFNFDWTRGELGDYVGGGLGGITVAFIIYTVWLQIGQINSQQNETFEAGVFRIFEALKPELEGLSARIISKTIKAKIVTDDGEPFDAMLKTFRSGDRTVFLRAMQKSKYCNAIRSCPDEKELKEAMDRFSKIMKLLDKSLSETAKNDDDDFSKAIKSTEIYETYRKCF